MISKKRVIKNYDALPEEVKTQIKITYPRGFAQHLLKYTDSKGNRVTALPFDAGEIYYLVRMTINQAVQIIDDDEDYDNEGVLKDNFFENKVSDEDILNIVKAEEEPSLLKNE